MGVRRFNLQSNAPDLAYPLTTNDMDYALDLQVRPGHPGTVAAAVGSYNLAAPYPSDVLVYDNGVPRILKGGPARGLAFASDGLYLFGSISPGSGNGLVRMFVGPDGLATDVVPAFSSAPGNLKFNNGRVYSYSGQVVDPYAPAYIGSVAASGPQAIDAGVGRAFFLAQRGTSWELRAFDLTTLRAIGTQIVASVQGTPSTLVRCGADRLAFCTTSNQLFVVSSFLIPSNSVPSSNLGVTQQAVQDFAAAVETLRFTIQVRNGGPGVANNVLVAIDPPAPVASITFGLPQGSITNSGANYLCNLGSLASGQSLFLQLSAVITNTSTFTNFVSVSSATPDPDLSDNTAMDILPGHFFQRTDTTRIFTAPMRALAYDPARQLLFAALSNPGNQLAWFDVESGSLQGTMFLGLVPDSLLVSQNGEYLYASATTTGLVQRVYLPSQTLDLSFIPPGALEVGSMSLLPGSPRSAALTFWITNNAVTAVFDDAVERPKPVLGMPFSLLSFATDGAALYGYANTGTGGNSPDVFRMSVSDAGLELAGNGPSDTPWGYNYGMEFALDRLFFENGNVLNPSTWTEEQAFTLPNWGSGMSVIGSLGRVAFLTSDFNNSLLSHVNIYSISGRQQLAQVDIRTASPGCGDLVWCGGDRFAFRTPTELVFVRSSAVPILTNAMLPTLTLLKRSPIAPPLLRIQTAAGHWYALESSSNLLNWIQLTNFYGTSASSDVIDSDSQGVSSRFYRVIQW
jgi:hypothetical protein